MAYTSEQVKQLFSSRIRELLTKIEKDKQDQRILEAEERQKVQDTWGKLNAIAAVTKAGKGIRDTILFEQLSKEYGEDTDEFGKLPKRYKFKEDVPLYEDIFAPLEETEGYKEFKIEEEALSWAKEEELERARDLVPLDEESVIDEPIAYERIMREEDVWTPPTEPAPLDMTAIDESTKRGLWNKWNQDQAESSKRFGMPKLSYDEWLKGVESGEISAVYTEKLEAPLVAPVSPEVPIDTEDDFYTPTEKVIETDDLPSSAPQPDYAKIQDAAEDQKLQDLRDIQTTPGVTPTESSDPELEKALQDLEQLKAPKVKGADEVLPEQLRASVGMSDMPDVEAPVDVGAITADPIAPGSGERAGQVFEAGQTVMELTNIGRTLTSEDATDEQKSIASMKGTKLLADVAGKKQVAKTGKKIFETAGGRVSGGLGGVLGGYVMATEAKEAGEAWKEKDYDEAILHGMGSASGGLQMAGGTMIASGIGAPLGAILYGVGAAGSLISGAGLFLEDLFGKKEEKVEEAPKFNIGGYLNSIRRQRRY